MKLKRFSIGTLGLLAVSGLAWSCSGKSEDCNANLTCAPYGGELGTSGASGASGSSGKGGTSGGFAGTSGGSGTSGEGGTDAAAGSGGAPPIPCDGTLGPDTDACVISDEFGVFVSPNGDSSSADGTQAHPYATVTQALAGIMKIKHVYVCAGEYQEPGALAIPDRVSIYGGFSCDGGIWKYGADTPAYLHSATPIGATIADAKVGVLIQDLRIDASNADDGTGASSFGLMVSGSQNVALKRVEIHAGKGGKGKSGTDGGAVADAIASGDAQKGKAAECGTSSVQLDGGVAVGVQCTSQGGKGGDGTKGIQTTTDRDGKTGFPGLPNGITASQSPNVSGGDGKEGAAGLPGILGAAAPMTGTFTGNGYLVANGGDGSSGQPGQGGGGGASSFAPSACVGASGGAGGMGGCGGTPGTGGGGGGASVGVFSWNSSLTIDACDFTGREGGAGGNGGKAREGSVGQEGGKGGAGNSTNQVGVGGKGGTGGNGGNGGSGAGGSGGPSIALVWRGTKPVLMNNPLLHFAEKAAAGGQGGQLGLDVANKAPDGSVGTTQDIDPKP